MNTVEHLLRVKKWEELLRGLPEADGVSLTESVELPSDPAGWLSEVPLTGY